MRELLIALCLAFALPVAASADPSTPGWTARDQAQFAKLAAGVGKWTCTNTPPSKIPDVVVGKLSGSWIVWRESGDTANTEYARWNHETQSYVFNEIDDSGSSMIATTKSLDPFNATWKVVYTVSGQPSYPFKVAFARGVMTWSSVFLDPKTGKLDAFKSVCPKS